MKNNNNRHQFYLNNFQNRPVSPVRQPNRPHSPINRSPYNNPAPLSPLRTRRFQRTPKKYEEHKIFYKSPRNMQNYATEQPEHIKHQKQKNYMQQTIKNGVGLFKNLAQQNKLNSDRKQNKVLGYGGDYYKNTANASNTPSKQSKNYQTTNTKPFQHSDRHKEGTVGKKFSFTNLLQNVKQIESIQGFYEGSHTNNRYSQIELSDISYKTNQKSKNEVSDRHIEMDKGPFIKAKGASDIKVQSKLKSKIEERSNQKARLEQIEQHNRMEQVSEDYQDIAFLLKKIEEKGDPRDQISFEQSVKMSLSNQYSLNMKPFL